MTSDKAKEEQDEESAIATTTLLLQVDEVYLYRIPPLTSATAGYRAEDWDLAKPIQTCRFRVQTQNNTLCVDFLKEAAATVPNHNSAHPQDDPDAVFASAKINLMRQKNATTTTITDQEIVASLSRWYEPVVDSSRYFVITIQNEKGQEAKLGFGFREREQAVDMREAFQYYEKSIQRQKEASKESVINTNIIPKLKEGEKIHINVKSSTSSSTTSPHKLSSTTITGDKKSKSGGGVPLLLKKPPPPAGS